MNISNCTTLTSSHIHDDLFDDKCVCFLTSHTNTSISPSFDPISSVSYPLCDISPLSSYMSSHIHMLLKIKTSILDLHLVSITMLFTQTLPPSLYIPISLLLLLTLVHITMFYPVFSRIIPHVFHLSVLYLLVVQILYYLLYPLNNISLYL